MLNTNLATVIGDPCAGYACVVRGTYSFPSGASFLLSPFRLLFFCFQPACAFFQFFRPLPSPLRSSLLAKLRVPPSRSITLDSVQSPNFLFHPARPPSFLRAFVPGLHGRRQFYDLCFAKGWPCSITLALCISCASSRSVLWSRSLWCVLLCPSPTTAGFEMLSYLRFRACPTPPCITQRPAM